MDPNRYPLLCSIAEGARWVGTDDFPSDEVWADECEVWLRFVETAGVLQHYLPRLKGLRQRRDEALAEIAVAYFFARKCGLSIAEWEPPGVAGTKGEFLLSGTSPPPVFVEVKAPGWEQEIAEAEGQDSPRLLQPKYVDSEARSTGPWVSVRHAVTKAYPKMPASAPTLLVINDDLIVSLADWRSNVDIALYCPRAPGYTSGYLAEDGAFVGARYANLGAVGVFQVDLPAEGIRYRFSVFENPHALPAVAIPAWVPRHYP